jgi:tetratricopeptide (TPR) repeat protein
MTDYRTADVARVLGVSPPRVRAMVRAGWCHPGRDGRAYTFEFQDLILLRTANGLLRSRVPARRVKRALSELQRQLPADRSLSGVRIYADARNVVVRDGDAVWQPASGQLLLDFGIDDLARHSAVVRVARRAAAVQSAAAPADSAADWFERALGLEDDDPEAARAAYERALALDPDLGDAYVNLGRLAHQADDPATAARCYHEALRRDAHDPVTHYNLALALEDLDKREPAILHYQRAVALNPRFADAHYNLGQILQRCGRRAEAMRHLMRYRALTRKHR